MRSWWFRVGLFLAVLISVEVVVGPTQSQVPKVMRGNTSIRELGVVRNRIDLLRLSGKHVKLVGYYTSQAWKPGINANTIEFQGTYIQSQIVLEDGTVIRIFPSWLKQSLRSSDEVAKYQGKIVEASGTIEFEAVSEISSKNRESFINLQELKIVK